MSKVEELRDGLPHLIKMTDHTVLEKDEEGMAHRYHTNWRCGELLPFRSTWPEKWQREVRNHD